MDIIWVIKRWSQEESKLVLIPSVCFLFGNHTQQCSAAIHGSMHGIDSWKGSCYGSKYGATIGVKR